MTLLKNLKHFIFRTPNVRIMRICPSPGHLTKFRLSNFLNEMSWSEQIKSLQNNNIFLPGSWAQEMEQYGCKVFDSLYDDEDLVRKWAEENQHLQAYTQTNPKFEILLKQAQNFNPNIIIFWTGGLYKVDKYHRTFLRKLLPNALFITVWGDEIPHNESYKNYFGDLDFAFAINSSYHKKFQDCGIRSIPFGSSFDTTLAPTKTLPIHSRNNDLIMCGDTGYLRPDHINRYRILSQLIKNTPLKVFSSEPNYESNNLDIHSPFYNQLPLKAIRPNQVYEGPVDAREYYQLLNNSKISINIHRDELIDYGNLRCFEVCGSGGILLTDRYNEISEFYKSETDIEKLKEENVIAEVIGFKDVNDCKKKIEFLLNDTPLLQKISDNATKKTRSLYTVKARSKFMFNTLLNLLYEAS